MSYIIIKTLNKYKEKTDDKEQITLIFNYIKLYFIKKGNNLKYFSNKVYKLLNEYFYLLNNCDKKIIKKNIKLISDINLHINLYIFNFLYLENYKNNKLYINIYIKLLYKFNKIENINYIIENNYKYLYFTHSDSHDDALQLTKFEYNKIISIDKHISNLFLLKFVLVEEEYINDEYIIYIYSLNKLLFLITYLIKLNYNIKIITNIDKIINLIKNILFDLDTFKIYGQYGYLCKDILHDTAIIIKDNNIIINLYSSDGYEYYGNFKLYLENMKKYLFPKIIKYSNIVLNSIDDKLSFIKLII